MAERHSEYERDEHDWYVEPASIVRDLLRGYPSLHNGMHDPCCGGGTIPETATAMGFDATGADLVDRANGRYRVMDFLKDTATYPSIVTNPPFKIAPQIIRHALTRVRYGGIVVAVCQAKFLFSQARHPLFSCPEMERVLVLSKRPSMPPGKVLAELGEACRGGGAIDYVWCIWRVGKTSLGASVEWVL